MSDRPTSEPGNPLALIGGSDTAYLGLLEHVLETEGLDVKRAASIGVLLDTASALKPDAVVLDGELAEALAADDWRRLYSAMPGSHKAVVVLADRSSPSPTTVEIDDRPVRCIYISRLSSAREIIESVCEAMTVDLTSSPKDRLKYADIDMHLASYRVHRAGREIHLTPIEYRLLKKFLEQPERVFSRDELAKALWPSRAHVGVRTVDVHMAHLRRALGGETKGDLIRTIRNVGYSLCAK